MDEYIDPDINYFQPIYSSFNKVNLSSYYTIDQLNQTEFCKNPSTFLLNFNIRSFYANIDAFKVFISSLIVSPQILILTETWLTKDNVEFCSIEGYNPHHTIRSVGRSGGVSVFTADHLNTKYVSELSISNETIESCTISIKSENYELFILAIYRPHSGTIDNFNDTLLSILNSPILVNKKVILTGDLNINLISTTENVQNYITNLQSLHYTSLITKPTRFTTTDNSFNPSIIDHIWTNITTTVNSGIIWSDITDHCPCFTFLNTESQISHGTKKIYFRIINETNIAKLLSKLENTNWDNVLTGNIDQKTESFINFVNKTFCDTFPKISKTISNKRLEKPWITPAILQSIKTKSYYFKLAKQGLITQDTNKRYRNLYNKITRKAKNHYYNQYFNTRAKNTKKTWEGIRDLLGNSNKKDKIQSLLINGEETDDPKLIASALNKYFSTVAEKLEKQIPETNVPPTSYITSSPTNSMFLTPTTPTECSNLIENLKNTFQGPDALPTKLFIKAKHILSIPISKLINECFCSGKFPLILKKGKITPIHKTGSKIIEDNYRPISVLLILSKMFERAYYNRATKFAEQNNFLSPSQFGFQKGKSTICALTKFIEFLYESINNKKTSISVFIDLKKAYDTIDHKILLDKAFKMGIRGLAHHFLQSFLSDRFQCVRVRDAESDWLPITRGVPQGSVLASFLFLIYINDLPTVSPNISSILFADDTTFYKAGNDINALSLQFNSELNKIKTWCQTNRLSLNISKTFMMQFGFGTPGQTSEIFIDNEPIQQKHSEKFLGIIIDKKLNFAEHIKHLCQKVSRTIGIFYKLRDHVPKTILISIYYSLAYPYFTYGNILWGGSYATHLKPLELLQKKLIRIICNTTYLAHTTPLFKLTGILKLPDIHTYITALHMYKLTKNPNFNNNAHQYNTRNRSNIQPQFQRLTTTQKSLNYTGPKIWNSIPIEIKNKPSLQSFKNHLKQHLIDQY